MVRFHDLTKEDFPNADGGRRAVRYICSVLDPVWKDELSGQHPLRSRIGWAGARKHCAFDFINSWGEVETQKPIPPNAAAAIFVFVELRLPAGTIGDEPVLMFMTGPALEFLSRLHPQIPLFTLELQGGEFFVPSATLLSQGESGVHRVTYTWSEEDVSFEVTEEFTFQSLGPMRVKQPLPPRQLCL